MSNNTEPTKVLHSAGEGKTSNVGFFSKHPVLWLSIVFWFFIWGACAEYLLFGFAVSIPVFVVALILSFFTFPTRFRFVGIFVWSAPLAFVLFMVFFQFLQFVIPSTQTYYVGMDVDTPTGLKTCKSMVRVNRNYLSENRIPAIPIKKQKIEGEAVFCDLGDGKNIVATLAFDKKDDTLTLLRLPKLALRNLGKAAPGFFAKSGDRIELLGEYIPILVTFDDTANPMSIRRIDPAKVADVVGEGYSLNSVWVEETEDDYKAAGIQNNLPWVGSRSEDGTWAYVNPFRKIGHSNVFRPFKRNI